MKTPEEIKKGLECCTYLDGCRRGCPYSGEKCVVTSTTDAISYIKQLEAQNAELVRKADELAAQIPKWVSVYDDIPVNEDDMLVLLEGKNADIAWFNGYDGTWHTNGYYSGTVTHWMPLPEIPEGENHD